MKLKLRRKKNPNLKSFISSSSQSQEQNPQHTARSQQQNPNLTSQK